MTDTIMKVAIKCDRCGKYRKHTEYKGALQVGEDPRNPVCDSCRAEDDATKALGIPVLAMTASGEEFTTFGKATGLDELAKQRREDEQDRQFAESLVHLDHTWDKFGKMVTDYQSQREVDAYYAKAQARFDHLVKIGTARRNTVPLTAKTAEMKAETTAIEARTAETQDRLAKARFEAEAEALKIARLQADIADCYERAEAGYRMQEQAQARRVAATLAREERDSEEWTFKAATTTDPVLRSAYLARAAGEDPDDDE